MPKKTTVYQSKYDAAHCRTFHIKLNLEYDNDIITKLAEQDSMQGYIKRLIREDIARTYPDSVTSFIKADDNDKTKETIPEKIQRLLELYKQQYGEEFKPQSLFFGTENDSDMEPLFPNMIRDEM